MHELQANADHARELDAVDPMRGYREQFLIPPGPDGEPAVYLCGNSLGLQPKAVRELVEQELDDWAALAVEAHFNGRTPWFSYHEVLSDVGARLVGGVPGEVVMMNSLTVNWHLMLVSFYRPTRERFKILIDGPTFPSDLYAVKSQLAYHGHDPTDGLIVMEPRAGEHTIRIEDVEELLERRGEEIAVVAFSGVNFFTGQWYEMARITEAAHKTGCKVGWDLAHAAGNVPLRLHEWDVDFAVWCSYKYLNSGPGAVAGCFVHERHGRDDTIPRFAGWWGNEPDTRFKMHLLPDFVPRAGAHGWQLSNPPILAMAPLRASLAMFNEAGMAALRAKSERLTGYLEFLLDRLPSGRVQINSPRDPSRRGCQLSMLVHDRPRELFQALERAGVMCDFREPNVIRAAPVPLYNTFEDVWRFAQVLHELLA